MEFYAPFPFINHWFENVSQSKQTIMAKNLVSVLKERYMGKKIHINFMEDPYVNYSGREGIVQFVDDMGQLHGTWGGCAIIPTKDSFNIVG